MPACHRHYPGRADGACSLVHPHRQRPSLCNSQVGSCNCCFGTCSAFTHVTACTLAESPSDPFHRELRQLRCLHYRLDCYRGERTSSRAGVAPAEVQRLSRRTITPIDLHRGRNPTLARPQQKNQATHGGEWPVLAKSSGEEGKLGYMLGGFCVLAVGVAGWAGAPSAVVFVIRRTSTRRFLARPSAVLFVSAGLSLPRPIT